MARPDICVKVLRLSFDADSAAAQKIVNNQPGLNKNAIGALLQNIKHNYLLSDDVVIQRVVLDLGIISSQHFSIHFHQRLHSALVKLFMQLEAYKRNAALPVQEVKQGAEALADAPLLAQAIDCLQPATLASVGQPAISSAALYPLLRRAIDAYSAPQAYQAARLTPQHVTLTALHYLLLKSEGQHWLSQHSLAHDMRDALAAAMARQEVSPEPLLHCVASLEALPVAQARAIAGRWIIPLWRYPGIAQAVALQAGKEAKQQAGRYLTSLLPGRPAVSSPGAYPEQAHTIERKQQASLLTSGGQQQAVPTSASQPPHGVRPRPVYLSGEAQSAPGLPVTNAGVVLFWPLFTPWFTALGLMEEKQFVSEEARWQAVVAMDWLVWEQDMPASERLVVNQFLCGLPVSEAPAALAPLSAELRQRTLAWVEAISQQLAAFEKMSLNDIRQLFLQRPGELFAEPLPAVLHIEPQPFDLLLTKWPWPLNLAYFPWFDVPLMIEWPGSEPAGARL